jgi:hypothetical protein
MFVPLLSSLNCCRISSTIDSALIPSEVGIAFQIVYKSSVIPHQSDPIDFLIAQIY